jgi:hypothetical protein
MLVDNCDYLFQPQRILTTNTIWMMTIDMDEDIEELVLDD